MLLVVVGCCCGFCCCGDGTGWLDPIQEHMLPPALLPIHPQQYEFWFSNEHHAQLFDANPWQYLPAFGGHCTHGISEAFGGMTAADLVVRLLWCCKVVCGVVLYSVVMLLSGVRCCVVQCCNVVKWCAVSVL